MERKKQIFNDLMERVARDAVQRVVDVVGLGMYTTKLEACRAGHAHSRGVRGQDHAAAAAGANRPV